VRPIADPADSRKGHGGTSAVGNGPAVNLEEGVGLGAGAIMPAPVNAQIEAEFEANPPWDQITAGTEEFEEEGEEWEEEYAAFGPAPSQLDGGPHIEAAVLYPALEGEGRREEEKQLAVLCYEEEHHISESARACARYADIFGDVKKALKTAWRKLRAAGGHVYGEAKRWSIG
jgi:hypothetical protein